jgi:hypothetical protein
VNQPPTNYPVLTFSWDINNQGTFDVSGANPTLSWSQLAGYGINGPGSFPITLRVTDGTNTVDFPTMLTVVDGSAPGSGDLFRHYSALNSPVRPLNIGGPWPYLDESAGKNRDNDLNRACSDPVVMEKAANLAKGPESTEVNYFRFSIWREKTRSFDDFSGRSLSLIANDSWKSRLPGEELS